MFDETFIHHAENTTDRPRVILFADIERPLYGRPFAAFNRWVENTMMRAASTQNEVGEPIGAINRVFRYAYLVRKQAKRLKAWDRMVYYLLKWVLIAGLLYAVLV